MILVFLLLYFLLLPTPRMMSDLRSYGILLVLVLILLVLLHHQFLKQFLVLFSCLGLHHIVLKLFLYLFLCFLEYLYLVNIILLYLLLFSILLHILFPLPFLTQQLSLLLFLFLQDLLVNYLIQCFYILFVEHHFYLLFDGNIHFYTITLLQLVVFLNHWQILNGLQKVFQALQSILARFHLNHIQLRSMQLNHLYFLDMFY